MSTVLLAEVAALLGDPSRANILVALLDGRARTSKELALMARIAPQTASGHLTKLTSSNLLLQEKQGRHRYFRLASPHVARLLEGLLSMAAVTAPGRHRPPSPADRSLRRARTCYDHVAGWVGVALADVLAARGHVVFADDGGEVTPAGWRFFADFGVDLQSSVTGRRCFCRPCLDWTERRRHIAGAVGAALAHRLFVLDWVRRVPDGRALDITAAGTAGLRTAFVIDVGQFADAASGTGAPRGDRP